MDNSQNPSQNQNPPQDSPRPEVPWFAAPQPAESSTQLAPEIKKPPRPGLKLSVVAFVFDSLVFFTLGPLLLLFAIKLGGFAWVLGFYLIYVLLACAIISIISAILYMIALMKSLKRQSPAAADILVMGSAHAVGYAIIYPVVFQLVSIPTILMAILLALCLVIPCIALIALGRYRKRNQQPAPTRVPDQNQKLRVAVTIALVVILVELIVGAVYAGKNIITFAGDYMQAHEYQMQLEQEMAAAKEDKDISDTLADISYALCTRNGNGKYNIIHQIPGNSEQAIIQCSDTGEIYEAHNTGRKTGYYLGGEAIYFGTTKDELLDRYLAGQPYLYRNSYNSAYNELIMLLVKADSLDQVIVETAPTILSIIHEANAKYVTDLDFIILYNESTSGINPARDFIVPAYSMGNGIPTWLPHGNGVYGAKGEYALDENPESLDVTDYVNVNHEKTYSSRMRDAMKFHDHLEFSVSDPDYTGSLKQMTLEELISIMTSSESCLRQNEQLGWDQCD